MQEQPRVSALPATAGPNAGSLLLGYGQTRDEVVAAQLRSLFQIDRRAQYGNLLLILLVLVYFFGSLPLAGLLAWGGLLATLSLLRQLLARRVLRRQGDTHASGARRLVTLVGLEALGWVALLSFAGFTGNPFDQAFLLFLIGILVCSSFVTLGFYMPAYLTLAVPVGIGLLAWLFTIAWEQAPWLVVAVGLATASSLAFAVHVSRVLPNVLRLGFERDELIARLTAEKERIQVTLRSIGDGVLTVDTDGRVTYLNPVAERLTGWSSEEACGQALDDVLKLVDEHTGERLANPVGQCVERDNLVAIEQEVLLVDRSGERQSAVEVSASPIRDHDRQVVGVVVVAHDVTELRGMARVMSYQANHDPLTGLVNRREFEARLWHALESARTAKVQHAMAYLDLDQFKLVNDTCGHVAGDELLKQLTGKFQRRLRDTDVLARLGGDEFGLLLHRCSMRQARRIAESLCDLVRDFRFVWDDKVFNIGVSIGLVPVDGTSTPTDLLAAADAACYVAKDQGRNRVHSVYPHDRELAHRHGEMQWTSRIQRALDDRLFSLRIQRIEPLNAEGPVLGEFLMNMLDGDGSLITPSAFLPAAERFHMMPGIDRCVVRMVFERVRTGAGDPQLAGIGCFTLNVSGQSLSDETFLEYVIEELRTSGVEPERICFEITETAVIANLERAKHFIQSLRQRGCKFALDDFGSGLSSFGYLRSLPVDFLKIDGLFVKHMSKDPIDYSMVEAIHQVGKVMGITTIAEFVEDSATLEMLREMGIGYAQGYEVHRPEPLR